MIVIITKAGYHLSAYDNRLVFDGEFADLAEGFGMWLQIFKWIKSELRENQERLFYYLVEDRERLATS